MISPDFFQKILSGKNTTNKYAASQDLKFQLGQVQWEKIRLEGHVDKRKDAHSWAGSQ